MAFGEGYTGGETEKKLFGAIEAKHAQEHPENFIDFRSPGTAKRWTEGSALDLIRGIQPYDPAFPTTDFTAELVDRVKRTLKLPRSATGVRFYTAVSEHPYLKTVLDRLKGTDGMLEVDLPQGTVRVGFDVTTNPEKVPEKEARGSVVVLWPAKGLDPEFDADAWDRVLGDVAKQVIDRLN